MKYDYEALFDVPAEKDPESLLWEIQRTKLQAREMGYRTKTIRGGEMLGVEVYPIIGPETVRKIRRKKEQHTPAQMQACNDRRAVKRLTWLINANFTAKDLSLTLTYAQQVTYEQAQKDARNFCRRVKRARERRGLPDPKYIYAVEDTDGAGESTRCHIHMLISGGMSREELENIWEKGYANCDRLQPDNHGLAALAKYISKARTKKSRRRWTCSRNLKKPQTRISDTKLTCRKVRKLGEALPQEAGEILEKLYPGYAFVECNLHFSDWTGGVYIEALMRRKQKTATG